MAYATVDFFQPEFINLFHQLSNGNIERLPGWFSLAVTKRMKSSAVLFQIIFCRLTFFFRVEIDVLKSVSKHNVLYYHLIHLLSV